VPQELLSPEKDDIYPIVLFREEVTKLLGEDDELVQRMQKEMEAVAEPVGSSTRPTEASAAAEEEDDEETADEQEPSILNVLKED
jgi:ribosomal protein L12E/L44/L45/RPP1/RPP2